ncbi:MDR family MFS transporter [Smaragdicoccus niigatensis]|uniref:MDR family MFS transporter n=1 Tax=Smaragdicoccus niigatensis TaxID=359359 RepID=UPI0003680AB6|nr:DHA2 family efflux MFS transporter permease subunit [Smaragdicoccus niigatensis]
MSVAVEEQDAPALSRAQINLVFATIATGMLLSAMDQTIVGTALPTIVGDLGGAGHMSWVVTGYLLAETVSTVLAGKFGDLFGRKRVFQAAVVVFIIGSFFCGLANSMTWLIIARTVQGIGGGALMVTATALVGDSIPLRDRGKYQGALGAVFGVTTVVGPLLGGLFTDHLSWRWAFYVNVPVAIIVIVMAAKFVPGTSSRGKPKIDYLGVLFVALGASGLTLATSWGGTEYAWGSPTIIGLFIASIVALVVFVIVETRVDDPILPMRLFKNRVFTVASVLSFIVGFAMLGSMTFLPIYMQFVIGTTATASGLRMLPMVFGLLIASTVSGNVVSKTGQYKIFPVVGTAVIAIGAYLLSTMDASTPFWAQSLFLLVFGVGIGLSMQVLTIIVQNTSEYRDLGTATSGVTFFRTIGGSFGASVMGSVYTNYLNQRIGGAMLASGVKPSDIATPAQLHALSAEQKAPIVTVYADAIQHMFLYVVPVAMIALVFAILLPQVKMRGIVREGAKGTGEGFAIAEGAKADTQLEDLIGRILEKHGRAAAPSIIERSQTKLTHAQAWGIMRVFGPSRILGRGIRLSRLESAINVPPGVLRPFYDELETAGYVARDGDILTVTPVGESEAQRIRNTWRSWLVEQLSDWFPEDQTDRENARMAEEAMERILTRVLKEEQEANAPV